MFTHLGPADRNGLECLDGLEDLSACVKRAKDKFISEGDSLFKVVNETFVS